MAKYYLLYRAIDDLDEIWDYTYEEWSENQADKYYQLFLDDCQEIAKNPALGKPYPQISNILLGYKSGGHIIFYKVTTSEEIEIVRILHGMMDLKKKFY